MHDDIGLPNPDSVIGIAAHDFIQLACQESVTLTRSIRNDGTPTVPSRWLTRLNAYLKTHQMDDDLATDGPHIAWAERIDQPNRITPAARPMPCPPIAKRPTGISVTGVEQWMRDPYGVYAKYILGLRALNPVEEAITLADRGQIIHDILDQFITRYPDDLPDDAVNKLLAIGEDVFADRMDHADVRHFWWPRFKRIADHFITMEAARRPKITPIAAEISGGMDLDGFRLSAKADRIDRMAGDGMCIIDYKTGSLPSKRDLTNGLSPQLVLEGLIANDGGFDAIPAARINTLSLWRLTGGQPPIETSELSGGIDELIDQARAGMKRLIDAYRDPTTGYPSVPDLDYAPDYNDYLHLARFDEWKGDAGIIDDLLGKTS
jgi:ATP-dependent helicase/nuclease subunit B